MRNFFFYCTHTPSVEVCFINILITGKPGVGKTTLIKKVVFHFQRKMVGGFYTQEILKDKERTGFAISTFDGKVGILAHKDYVSAYRVGKYKVNMDDLEEVAVKSIEDALDEGKELIIIDEIGKMELFSDRFKKVVEEALNEEMPVIGTIMKAENPFCDRIKARDDVKMLTINAHNRDTLHTKVLESLGTGSLYMQT